MGTVNSVMDNDESQSKKKKCLKMANGINHSLSAYHMVDESAVIPKKYPPGFRSVDTLCRRVLALSSVSKHSWISAVPQHTVQRK